MTYLTRRLFPNAASRSRSRRLAGRAVAAVLLVALGLPAALLAAPATADAQGLSGWTATTGIDPPNTSDNELQGVSCQSATQCLSVGTSFGEASYLPITDALQGSTTWVPSTVTLESDDVSLQSVSCVSTTWCMGVGWEYDSSDSYHLIAAVYSLGTWTVNSALEQQAYRYPGSARLEGVSCTSETFCVAVGYTDPYYYSYYETPVVFTFDGTSWTQVSSIPYDSSFSSGALYAVSCADATDCAAVGQFYNDNVDLEQSFAVELSPSGWTLVDDIDNTSYEASSELDGVSCPLAGQCEAVGEYTDTYYGDTWALAGSLDGSSWSPDYYDATPASLEYGDAQLTSVSCISPSACVAAGAGGSDGIVDVFSGGSWTDTALTGQYGAQMYLFGVSCSSDSACQAVGYEDAGGNLESVAVSGDIPPSLSGPTSATFTQGTFGSARITATGAGPLTLSETGALPPNVTFLDQGSTSGTDTAVLSGTPGPFTGDYPFTITATDGNGNQTSESFDLTVNPLGPNPPLISLITPDVASAAGGKVTISGHYFSGAIAVLFNGMPATSFTVVSSTSITAVAPPYSGPSRVLSSGIHGSYLLPEFSFTGTIGNVEVVTGEGASTASEDSAFQYVPPAPSYVSPSSAVGGQTVTIYGSFLTGATTVWFAGVKSPKFKVATAGTSIQAVVPYGIAGSTGIEVDSAVGRGYSSSNLVLKGPVITKISPASGPYDAGSTITITGADFYDVYQVNFGTYSTEDFTVNPTGTQLTVVEPEGPTGTVNVSVAGDYGTSAANPASVFVNIGPRITAVLPNTATTGSLITVAGTGLANITEVYFGTVPADFFYNTDTTITVEVPAGLGTSIVNVRVINPDGESPITTSDRYEN